MFLYALNMKMVGKSIRDWFKSNCISLILDGYPFEFIYYQMNRSASYWIDWLEGLIR